MHSIRRIYNVLTRPAPLNEFDEYDDYWKIREDEGRVGKVLDRYRTIASSIPKDSRVLDVGCGDGSFLSYLRSVRPDCEVAGVDISETAIELTTKRGITAFKIDADQSLGDQIRREWDVIVMMEVIEHIPNAEKTVRDIVGLEPKFVFITIPNVGYILCRARLAIGGRFPITSIFYHMREHLRFWTVKDFIQWAPTVNLRVESYYAQYDESGKFLSFLVRTFPALLSNRLVYKLVPTIEAAEK
jgi:methionine biosynthesis protein MetW